MEDIACRSCRGIGSHLCGSCSGRGYHLSGNPHEIEPKDRTECSICGGAGKTKCPVCDGSGKERLTI